MDKFDAAIMTPKTASTLPSDFARRLERAARLDGWHSMLTGMGTARDRATSVSFAPKFVPNEMARSLWLGDDLAARAVEVWPDEMIRRGYRLLTADDKDAEDSIKNHLDAIGLDEALNQALCYQRAFGGGAVLLGANDGALDWAEPLAPERVKTLDWVQTYDATELLPSRWGRDGNSPLYGKPTHYRIGRATAGNLTSRDIHASRFLIFDGIRVSSNYEDSINGGWGYNVLGRLWTVLSGFNMGWAGAWHLLSDFAQGVYKMKGLADDLEAQQEHIMNRLRAMDMAKSTMRSIVVDAELESYERQATPISGLADVLDKANIRLAAAADMPLMLLFGLSPGGLGSQGTGELEAFYGRVSAKQTKVLKPALLRVVSIVAPMYKLAPGFKISFNPLWQPSEKEAADTRYVQAQTDQIYITTQVATPEEIATSRFGTSGYSTETQLDWEAREQFAQATTGELPEEETAMEDPNAIAARNNGQAPPVPSENLTEPTP